MTSLSEGDTEAEISQKPIELILLRELASRLDMPVSLFDANRKLVYLNEAAEKLLAIHLEDFGELAQTEITDILRPFDTDGQPIPPERMPSGMALIGRRPQHTTIWVHDLNGVAHLCAVTGLPLDDQGGGAIGAMCIIWEIHDGDEAPPTVP